MSSGTDIQRKPAPRHTVVMANEVKSIGFWRAVAAEFVGMFFFIFISLASISGWNAPYIPSMVQISLAFGLGLATSIHVTAHISGGHLNPAVSFAFLMLHRITPLRFLFYSLAQMIGAIGAAGMVRAITPADINNALGATTPGTDVTEWQALLMELVITYQLVLVIFATIDKRRPSSGGSGPLAIGIAVLVAHLCAGVETPLLHPVRIEENFGGSKVHTAPILHVQAYGHRHYFGTPAKWRRGH